MLNPENSPITLNGECSHYLGLLMLAHHEHIICLLLCLSLSTPPFSHILALLDTTGKFKDIIFFNSIHFLPSLWCLHYPQCYGTAHGTMWDLGIGSFSPEPAASGGDEEHVPAVSSVLSNSTPPDFIHFQTLVPARRLKGSSPRPVNSLWCVKSVEFSFNFVFYLAPRLKRICCH